MANAHAGLGDAAAAFARLDRAAAAHDLNPVCLAMDPSFHALRDYARWRVSLTRYRLPVVSEP